MCGTTAALYKEFLLQFGGSQQYVTAGIYYIYSRKGLKEVFFEFLVSASEATLPLEEQLKASSYLVFVLGQTHTHITNLHVLAFILQLGMCTWTRSTHKLCKTFNFGQ